jgi:hypothetical protein
LIALAIAWSIPAAAFSQTDSASRGQSKQPAPAPAGALPRSSSEPAAQVLVVPAQNGRPAALAQIAVSSADPAQTKVFTPVDKLVAALRPSAPAPRTLVIPAKSAEPPAIAQIVEDMAVMSRLLDKALGREAAISQSRLNLLGWAQLEYQALGPSLAGLADQTLGIFLEGYGALFVTSVDYPLAPPDTKNAEKKKVEESAWEKARRELYGPAPQLEYALRSRGVRKEYDAKKVEQLERTLLETLPQAANIRCLKPEDSVSIAVFEAGGSAAAHLAAAVEAQNPFGAPARNQFDESRTAAALAWMSAARRASVLVIRVKTSDIDAASRGATPLDQWRDKAVILKY